MKALEFTNRKGDIYYLQKMIGKNNKEKYVFSKQLKYEPIEKIPDGFEIYEVPTTGLVLLRKFQKKIFTEKEIYFFEKALKKNKKIGKFRVEEKKQELIVYTSEKESLNSILKVLSGIFEKSNPLLKDDAMGTFEQFFDNNTDLESVLKISILKENPRNYVIERYFYSAKGNESPWLFIDSSKNLKKLADKYCKYIYTDEYYNLI